MSAFTLIEVAVALIILGSSLIVLLGLQSSIIERTLRDTKKQRAMLIARQILAAVEVSPDTLNPETTQGSLDTIMSKLLPAGDSKTSLDPQDAEFQAQLAVESVGIPGVGDNLMRKVTVTVWWSSSPADQISAIYFIPALPAT